MSHPWLDAAAAYALDALDEAERGGFERHLKGCPECQDEIERLRATTDVLAYSAPAAVLPAGLRDRVMREALSKPDVDDSPSASQGARARGNHHGRWWVLAAASVALVAAIWAWTGERATRQALEQSLADAGVQNESLRRQLLERQSLLDTLLGPDVVTAALSATESAPSVRVFWNRRQGLAVVTAFGLPTAPPGRTYQLWGIDTAAGTAPVSLGTFDTDPGSQAILSLPVPAGAVFDLAAVTEEPGGGSPQPTSQPFLVGGFAGN